MKHTPQQEQRLMTEIWDPQISDDPYAFVRFIYPWNKSGTPLEGIKGPRTWQADFLQELADFIKSQKQRVAAGQPLDVFRGGRASGRGPGKSALLGMISHWFMSSSKWRVVNGKLTQLPTVGGTTIVAANGEPQLRTITFPEIGKWFTYGLNSHWFDTTSLQIGLAPWYGKLVADKLKVDPKYFYVQGKLWTLENPSAFAGAHSSTGMLLIFDEASGIPGAVWDVGAGYLTDTTIYRFWLAFSNPRLNSGGFYDRFHNPKMRQHWRLGHIDSRTVEGVDQAYLNTIIEEHGIESDVTRIEVLGQFPGTSDRQFISNELADRARERDVVPDPGAPLVIGVDISRHGEDYNVCRFRQGPDARTIPALRWRSSDLTVTADRVAAIITEYNPDAVCIDIGMGAAVGDMLRRRGFRGIHLVDFGSKANNPIWANKGTEMYAEMRDWMRENGCIDTDEMLYGDIVGRQIEFFGPGKDKFKLEAKDAYRTRAKRSPDDADALALTFAVKPARRDMRTSRGAVRTRVARDVDYSLFG